MEILSHCDRDLGDTSDLKLISFLLVFNITTNELVDE